MDCRLVTTLPEEASRRRYNFLCNTEAQMCSTEAQMCSMEAQMCSTEAQMCDTKAQMCNTKAQMCNRRMTRWAAVTLAANNTVPS
jgi:hypothetical protein